MLYAFERHSLALIPSLAGADAPVLLKEYSVRYRPWERLPALKKGHRTLKAKARAS